MMIIAGIRKENDHGVVQHVSVTLRNRSELLGHRCQKFRMVSLYDLTVFGLALGAFVVPDAMIVLVDT